MDWKISWWICVLLFSLFILTETGDHAFGDHTIAAPTASGRP